MSLSVGSQLGPWTIDAIDPEKMKLLAVLLDDPNPIHLDAEMVRNLGLGPTVINQGPANLGYIINLLQSELPGAQLRHLSVRFLANVFGGEQVDARAEVTGASLTDDGRQLLELEIWLEAGDRGRALAGTATLIVPA